MPVRSIEATRVRNTHDFIILISGKFADGQSPILHQNGQINSNKRLFELIGGSDAVLVTLDDSQWSMIGRKILLTSQCPG